MFEKRMSDTTAPAPVIDTYLVNTVLCIGILVIVVLSIVFAASIRTLEIHDYKRRFGKFPREDHIHTFNREPLL